MDIILIAKEGIQLHFDQAQEFIDSIPLNTLRSRRDAALIGLLLGCGLRRSEAVALRLEQIQRTQGHWVIADLFGKGGRLRTAPVPDWSKALIDSWLRASGVREGLVFRRIWKNRSELGSGVAADVVWTALKQDAKRIGVDHLARHGLRRTCARLCHASGGELEQIQFLLGHVSVQTTERYLGCKQRIQSAVNDRIGIEPNP